MEWVLVKLRETYFTPKHVLCALFSEPTVVYGSGVVRQRDSQFVLRLDG